MRIAHDGCRIAMQRRAVVGHDLADSFRIIVFESHDEFRVIHVLVIRMKLCALLTRGTHLDPF
jgi:hypothetical protein